MMNNNDFTKAFLDKFKEVHMTDYKRNFKLDNKSVTSFRGKVSDLEGQDQIRVLQIIVEKYKDWSTNSHRYPLTTRTLTHDWIIDKARDALTVEKKAESQVEEKTVVADKRQSNELSWIEQMIQKGRS
jgi:sulfite reductase beta subunit-like hemoprotein